MVYQINNIIINKQKEHKELWTTQYRDKVGKKKTCGTFDHKIYFQKKKKSTKTSKKFQVEK